MSDLKDHTTSEIITFLFSRSLSANHASRLRGLIRQNSDRDEIMPENCIVIHGYIEYQTESLEGVMALEEFVNTHKDTNVSI